MRHGAVASRRSSIWSRSGLQHRVGAQAHGARTHRSGGGQQAPTAGGGGTAGRGGRRVNRTTPRGGPVHKGASPIRRQGRTGILAQRPFAESCTFSSPGSWRRRAGRTRGECGKGTACCSGATPRGSFLRAATQTHWRLRTGVRGWRGYARGAGSERGSSQPQVLRVCARACVSNYTCVYVWVYIYIYSRRSRRYCVCVWCACARVRVYIRVYVSMYVYIYTYIYKASECGGGAATRAARVQNVGRRSRRYDVCVCVCVFKCVCVCKHIY